MEKNYTVHWYLSGDEDTKRKQVIRMSAPSESEAIEMLATVYGQRGVRDRIRIERIDS